MLIECTIRRPEGTRIMLGSNHYAFLPGPDGKHVAEVTVPAHVDRLLQIRESFRPAEPAAVAKPRRGRPRKVTGDAQGT